MLCICMCACMSVYLCNVERHKHREDVFGENNEVEKRQQQQK